MCNTINLIQCLFSSVQSLSCVWLLATPWTAARQASLSITNFWSLLKLMSIELVSPLSPKLMRNANRTSSRMEKSCISLHFNTEFISKIAGDTCGIRSAFWDWWSGLEGPWALSCRMSYFEEKEQSSRFPAQLQTPQRLNLRKTTWFPRHCKMRPLPAPASQE